MNTDDNASQHNKNPQVALPASANGAATRATTKSNDVVSESHRIYWQQWLSSNEKSVGSRREWVTSSAAVRISTVARAADVTGLLRESLQLSPLPDGGHEKDALVLVGTLYSLSRDYVRFEHEKNGPEMNGQYHPNMAQLHNHHSGSNRSTSSTSSDSFNVMQTLQPWEYPLQVRNAMADHLRKLQAEAVVGRTIIAPKLQWYYCPVVQPSDKQSLIPSCINLEGYCTSMEEEEGEWGYDDDDDADADDHKINDASGNGANGTDDENDSTDAGTVQDMDLLATRFPWLRIHNDDNDNFVDGVTRQSTDVKTSSRYLHRKKQFRRENRRLHALSAYEASVPQGTLSGYLLKRSNQDMHVWRRVHCVLTDDYLWFISRRYKKYDLSFAKHGRVRLTRALLLEPSVDYAPLYRTPYAFEMVATDGTSHIFRAANRTVQRLWIKTISDRIIQSYENSLLQNAQLIVNDECIAQAKRIDSAMDHLWDRVNKQSTASKGTMEDPIVSTRSGPLGKVLRWTLKVTDFRHFCRHVRSTLPPKSPVVVTTPSSTRKVPPPSALLAREISGEHVRVLDPLVQSMVRASWQQAATLLTEATEVGQYFLQLTSQPHRNLETLLRHVEFVLTGRQRSVRVSSGNSVASPGEGTTTTTTTTTSSSYQDRGEPPPMDLFDALENELQGIAVSMSELL